MNNNAGLAAKQSIGLSRAGTGLNKTRNMYLLNQESVSAEEGTSLNRTRNQSQQNQGTSLIRTSNRSHRTRNRSQQNRELVSAEQGTGLSHTKEIGLRRTRNRSQQRQGTRRSSANCKVRIRWLEIARLVFTMFCSPVHYCRRTADTSARLTLSIVAELQI